MPDFTVDRRLLTVDGRHSVRNDSTGFATAALIAWKLTVINVIAKAPAAEIINIQSEMLVL